MSDTAPPTDLFRQLRLMQERMNAVETAANYVLNTRAKRNEAPRQALAEICDVLGIRLVSPNGPDSYSHIIDHIRVVQRLAETRASILADIQRAASAGRVLR